MSFALVDVVCNLVMRQLLIHLEYSELIFDSADSFLGEFPLLKLLS